MGTKINLACICLLSTALVTAVFTTPRYAEATEEPIFRYGHVGPTVVDLQYKLKENGYYPYAIDGIFGSKTKTAIQKFQLNKGLTADGVAGPKTLTLLYQNETIKEVHYAVDPSLIQLALDLTGTPYIWGGTTTNGFDCSGFIKYVFAKKGIEIPRTVKEIWRDSIWVSHPHIGDVVFFDTDNNGPSHAGIYIGHGKFIHAGTTKGVKISKLASTYWKPKYIGSKRIVQLR